MSNSEPPTLNRLQKANSVASAPASPSPDSQETGLPPMQLQTMDRSLDDVLNSMMTSDALPPLALADGNEEFNGDATNDWFYPGVSVRWDLLPEVDVVAVQVMEISQL